MYYIQNPSETFTRLLRRRPHIFCGLALFNVGCCYGFDVINDKTWSRVVIASLWCLIIYLFNYLFIYTIFIEGDTISLDNYSTSRPSATYN